MASVSPEELRDLLGRDLPDALAPQDGAAPTGMLATSATLVLPEHIPVVARYLRDRLGYQYLSNITAVDFLADGLFELVYHFYQLAGGPPLVVKVRVPRDAPSLPSLTSFWPGAALQEREAFDLFGVTFPDHPDLRRVYMWDEFEGFPMRKDFPRQGDKYIEDE